MKHLPLGDLQARGEQQEDSHEASYRIDCGLRHRDACASANHAADIERRHNAIDNNDDHVAEDDP
jgi:hypothetical protein